MMEIEEAIKKWNRTMEELQPLINRDWYKKQMYKLIGCKKGECPFWREDRGCIADRCVMRKDD